MATPESFPPALCKVQFSEMFWGLSVFTQFLCSLKILFFFLRLYTLTHEAVFHNTKKETVSGRYRHNLCCQDFTHRKPFTAFFFLFPFMLKTKTNNKALLSVHPRTDLTRFVLPLCEIEAYCCPELLRTNICDVLPDCDKRKNVAHTEPFHKYKPTALCKRLEPSLILLHFASEQPDFFEEYF